MVRARGRHDEWPSFFVAHMNDAERQIEQLELFNEKVNEFRESSFADAIFAPDSGLSISVAVGKVATVERRGPNTDSIKAWAPTIRLLISAKERISFVQMRALYAELVTSGKCPAKPGSELLQHVEQFLERPLHEVTQIHMEPLQINGQEPSVRMFLEQFLYGDILHLDRDKRRNYVNWRSQPFIFQFALNDFCVLGARLLTFALNLTSYNNEVIKNLKIP
jgi:hypothetical protein